MSAKIVFFGVVCREFLLFPFFFFFFFFFGFEVLFSFSSSEIVSLLDLILLPWPGIKRVGQLFRAILFVYGRGVSFWW